MCLGNVYSVRWGKPKEMCRSAKQDPISSNAWLLSLKEFVVKQVCPQLPRKGRLHFALENVDDGGGVRVVSL